MLTLHTLLANCRNLGSGSPMVSVCEGKLGLGGASRVFAEANIAFDLAKLPLI